MSDIRDVIDGLGNVRDGLIDVNLLQHIVKALDKSLPDIEREYNIGVVQGTLVGIGFEPVSTLRVAEATYGAHPGTFTTTYERVNLWRKTMANRQERLEAIANASGVLWGYKEATAYSEDAQECIICDRRLCTDVDDWKLAVEGYVCGEGDCSSYVTIEED